MRRSVTAGLCVVALLVGIPGVASAHEIAGRFQAPIPLTLLFGGAAATVALTALVLAVAVTRHPREAGEKRSFVVPSSVVSGVSLGARGLFFAAFVLAVVTGVSGTQVAAESFTTVFVWAVWLKGVAIVSALLGSPWRVLSPWRALYDGLVRLEGESIAVLGGYPDRLGTWPALAGFLVWIGLVENLTGVPRSPRLTALLLAGYALVMVAGGLAFGPEWFRRADALAVLYRLFGRVAPIRLAPVFGGYRVGIRAPWAACTRSVPGLATVAFVIATVYTVSFDGFTSTPEFQTLLFGVRDLLGLGAGVAALLYLAGFVGFVAVFLGVVYASERVAGVPAPGWTDAALAFAPTVLPIAVAYEVAHNYPFVLGNLGQLPAVAWPFVAGHGPSVDLLAWLSLGAFWWSQVLLIVAGHVVAVVAAHYVALSRHPTPREARRGHLPLVVLMVSYTVVSLWIVSRPIVTG